MHSENHVPRMYLYNIEIMAQAYSARKLCTYVLLQQ